MYNNNNNNGNEEFIDLQTVCLFLLRQKTYISRQLVQITGNTKLLNAR